MHGCNNASALRRAAKRREALATARPFVVATVGFGDTYVYCKGILCYTLDDRLRILDLHRSAQYETVISIPRLLTQALNDIDGNTKGVFQVLYCSDNIVSCVYKSSGADWAAWLVAFDMTARRILVTEELGSTDKIFVRHNQQFLYYGTHSELGADGYKKWVIQGYDFGKEKWFDQKIHLHDMVGSEIGSTICFEFHDGYFYALSNQTSFEVEEIDWTSFYHCVRFPLESPCNELLERTEDHSMWRRQHQEGPIDDRWTSLRLDVDESTGDLKIVESRKEWQMGSSRSQRTYYTTNIIFPGHSKDDGPTSWYNTEPDPWTPFSPAASTSPSVQSAVCSGSSASATRPVSDSSVATSTSGTASSPKLPSHDLSALPNEPILRLLQPDDNPHHMRPPPRLPQNTHPGNDGSNLPTFTLAKCRVRYYHTSASTFLDLVDDPLPTDWKGTQRLRLRAGSRKLGPPLMYPSSHPKAGLYRKPSADLPTALREMYIEQPIHFWPPAQDPSNIDEDVDALYKLLNPPTHIGNVEGTADERSVVYVTGGKDRPQAIVFVGFDPAFKLVGVKRWGGTKEGMCQKGVGEGPHISGRASGSSGTQGGLGMAGIDVHEADRKLSIDRKGKGKARSESEPWAQFSDQAIMTETEETAASPLSKACPGRNWAWIEKPMYQDINLGYHFGLERNQNI